MSTGTPLTARTVPERYPALGGFDHGPRRMNMSRIEIDGWAVAQVDLERSWSGQEPPDTCWLFRSPSTWTLVTMRHQVHYGDDSGPSSGRATITTREFSRVEELAEEVERIYVSGAWVELLDAGYEHDPELYTVWAAERIRRDFDGASIHRKDLALYTGLSGGEAVPAPARELRGWEDEAVEQMAQHLVDLGFEVPDERPTISHDPSAWGDPALGTLRVRRYGWETIGIVRIDSVGEVFVRLLDSDEVTGPLFRPGSPESDPGGKVGRASEKGSLVIGGGVNGDLEDVARL